jgi:hypothetical protein
MTHQKTHSKRKGFILEWLFCFDMSATSERNEKFATGSRQYWREEMKARFLGTPSAVAIGIKFGHKAPAQMPRGVVWG